MGLHGAERVLTSFKTANHKGTLEGRNDERRQFVGVLSWANIPPFDSASDH